MVGSGFGTRLRICATDPTVLAGVSAAAALCLLRSLGFVANIPYWELVLLVVIGQALNIFVDALWVVPEGAVRLSARVGVSMIAITLVAYGIGWGPLMSIGFIYGAADAMRSSGSRVGTPAMIWSLICIAGGQLAIAFGLAPTLIPEPLVHGLAVLCGLGTILTIKLMVWSAKSRESLEADLSQSERRFRALVQNASDIIMVVDQEGRSAYVSPAFERVLDRPIDDLEERSTAELIHPDDVPALAEVMGELTEHPDRIGCAELRLLHADGEWRWFEASVANRLDDLDVGGIVSNLHEISERKRAERALQEAHETFRSSFENAPIGMALTNLEGTIIRSNRAYAEILGMDPTEPVGMSIRYLTHPAHRDETAVEMNRLVSGEIDGYRLEKRYIHHDGHDVWVSVSVSCVRDVDGVPLYLIGQIEDITERRAMQERLAHAAIHDPLTGLPNRVLFMDRLEVALRHAKRQGRIVGVIFLDLDRFKLVNDSMGHATGDRLLEEVAARLRLAVRGSDTVARFGGDEFTVLCDDVADENDAVAVAERLMEAFGPPLSLEGDDVFVSASIGVALSSGPGDTSSSLLRDADIAMYRAKDRGRSRIEIFDQQSHVRAVEQLRTDHDLHRAIERDEFRLLYQPVVDLRTGVISGLEALLRWNHPARGLLRPAEFIPLAEETGLIVPIGKWVLEEGCRQVVEWREGAPHGGARASLSISVNLSPRQFSDPALVEDFVGIIEEAGVDPGAVWLELTEGTLMQDAEGALAVLGALRDEGVHFSVDDFGTGYSSLGYLERFPVEALKVDRSFVASVDCDAANRTIVKAVVDLAHALGFVAVAEGVETPGQLETLRQIGCDMVQGYLLGRPVAAAVVGRYLAEGAGPWDAALRQSAGDRLDEPAAV